MNFSNKAVAMELRSKKFIKSFHLKLRQHFKIFGENFHAFFLHRRNFKANERFQQNETFEMNYVQNTAFRHAASMCLHCAWIQYTFRRKSKNVKLYSNSPVVYSKLRKILFESNRELSSKEINSAMLFKHSKLFQPNDTHTVLEIYVRIYQSVVLKLPSLHQHQKKVT